MNKIVLKHTRIEINNYDMGDCPRLERNFSVWDPITHKSYPKGIEYNEKEKRLIIPRGVDVRFIEDLFLSDAYVDRTCDPYINTEPIQIKYLPRDQRQKSIMKFILGMDEYKYTSTKSQISCNSATGSGKTYITIAAMCYSGSRCIIITSSIQWLEQWKAKIFEYTKLDPKQVYMVNGSASINKLLSRNPLKYQIFLASHSTLKSYGDRYGWDKIEDFFRYIQCGVKVYDEAHLYFDNMCKIDFHSDTRKTLYLTATPERSSQEEDRVYQLYFKNIPSIALFDETNDPHVNYSAIHYSSHPSPIDISQCKNQYGMDRNKYVSYVVNREYFLKLTAVLIDMVLGIDGKVLIYIGTNHAIQTVYSFLCKTFPFLQNHIGIYTSIIKDQEEKDQMLLKKIILSTTKSCGAASDIADLAVTINLAEPFKSKVLAQQTLGRCRADNTLYIDVVDHGFYYTKKYYEAKRHTFATYAKSCKDIHMSDDEIDMRYNAIIDKYNNYKVMCMKVYKQ